MSTHSRVHIAPEEEGWFNTIQGENVWWSIHMQKRMAAVLVPDERLDHKDCDHC